MRTVRNEPRPPALGMAVYPISESEGAPSKLCLGGDFRRSLVRLPTRLPSTFSHFGTPVSFHQDTDFVHTLPPVQNVPRGTLLHFVESEFRKEVAADLWGSGRPLSIYRYSQAALLVSRFISAGSARSSALPLSPLLWPRRSSLANAFSLSDEPVTCVHFPF